MGTGHSIDTPIRVAPFGISSVISIVDDLLVERVRKHYAHQEGLPYEQIPRYAEDGRSRRITAYLDLVREIVHRRLEAIKQLPFFEKNDKSKYFEMLPDSCDLKQDYEAMLRMSPGPDRERQERSLTQRMLPGSIDVNIMTKLDRLTFTREGKPLSDEYSDAKTALRGYAESALNSAVIFSAGLNQSLFGYMTRFRDFYRSEMGEIRKKVVLKVSDFRSALIQGKLLARKGLEVHEFRIESGLNCGGHAFASDGELLPTLLRDFKEKRDQLKAEFLPMIRRYYESMGWEYPKLAESEMPLVTVQGGIGTPGEAERMLKQFGMDRTGWGSPFLLVPEATCVDEPTRRLLADASEKDVYLSDVSPLGVPFNNVRRTGSEQWTQQRADEGRPGSPCPKGFLVSNTEFTERPICTASSEFQDLKVQQLDAANPASDERRAAYAKIVRKVCLCDHLGNGALIALGIAPPANHPQAICPGPNIAWFNREYTLREMVDHIYGRGPSIVPAERPHMFAKEVTMYVDYFERLLQQSDRSPKSIAALGVFLTNLLAGMDYCLELAAGEAYGDENLASIEPRIHEQRERLEMLALQLEPVEARAAS
jgi:hypothetical protein